jgi:flagellar biosynthesis protein FlhB
MADKSQKTEEPTPRRLEKARKEGQFPAAKELIAGLQFLTFVVLLSWAGPMVLSDLKETTRVVLRRAFGPELSIVEVVRLGRIIGYLLVVIGLAVRLATTKMGFSLKKLSPDLKRLNPVQKLQNLPQQNIQSFLQSAVLLPVFLAALYYVARENLESILLLPLLAMPAALSHVNATMMDLLWKAAAVFMILGFVDLWRQQKRFRKDLRMSKQEIRDEMKETEGDPQIRARIRKLQRDRVRQKMMAAVPKATAVITNPTHFAVAIHYELGSQAAPKVVAKGKDHLALRIRKIASENQVPIIENPPLARGLYDAAEVGQEIPAHLYRAVAEILAYIFRLSGLRPRG